MIQQEKIASELIELLKAGSLRLSNWSADHAALIQGIALEDLASNPKRPWPFEKKRC